MKKLISRLTDKHGCLSEVFCENDMKYFRRLVGNQYGELTQAELMELKKDILSYYSALKAVDVSVPTFFSCKVKDNLFQVEITMDYYEKSLQDIIIKDKHWETYLNLYFDLFSKLFLTKDKKDGLLNVSIDPHPSNFRINKGNLVYTDFTPPFVRLSQKWNDHRRLDEVDQMVEWKVNRYFSMDGLIIDFLNRFCEYYVDFKNNIISEVANFVSKNNLVSNETVQLIRSTTESNIKPFVSSSSPKDRDVLRFIFLKFFANNSEEVVRVFRQYKSPQSHNDFKIFLLELFD